MRSVSSIVVGVGSSTRPLKLRTSTAADVWISSTLLGPVGASPHPAATPANSRAAKASACGSVGDAPVQFEDIVLPAEDLVLPAENLLATRVLVEHGVRPRPVTHWAYFGPRWTCLLEFRCNYETAAGRLRRRILSDDRIVRRAPLRRWTPLDRNPNCGVSFAPCLPFFQNSLPMAWSSGECAGLPNISCGAWWAISAVS